LTKANTNYDPGSLLEMGFVEHGIFAKSKKAFLESQIFLSLKNDNGKQGEQVKKISSEKKLGEEQEKSTNEALNFSDFDDQVTDDDQASESFPGMSNRSVLLTEKEDKNYFTPVFANGGSVLPLLENKKEGAGNTNSSSKPRIDDAVEDHSFTEEKKEKRGFIKKMDFTQIIDNNMSNTNNNNINNNENAEDPPSIHRMPANIAKQTAKLKMPNESGGDITLNIPSFQETIRSLKKV
jgi:hypothetical protein